MSAIITQKQELLALKWVIAEQFHQYLLWKPFIVKTDKNPLTYIITPNLDATWHQGIDSFAWITFSIEYQKGYDNAATDALSCVTSKLNAKTMKSILGGVDIGTTERADAQNPVVAKVDKNIHKPFQETVNLAWAACIDLHVTGWVTAQQEDPTLKATVDWISDWKVWDLKHLVGDDANTEEGKTILWEWKKLMLYWGTHYHCHTPWWTGGSFAMCGPQGSLGSCHKWMSPWCQTPRPTVDTELTEWSLLVAWHSHTDADGN